jgi:hypothetical protein
VAGFSADVAQLVERRLPKPKVASSSLVVRLGKSPVNGRLSPATAEVSSERATVSGNLPRVSGRQLGRLVGPALAELFLLFSDCSRPGIGDLRFGDGLGCPSPKRKYRDRRCGLADSCGRVDQGLHDRLTGRTRAASNSRIKGGRLQFARLPPQEVDHSDASLVDPVDGYSGANASHAIRLPPPIAPDGTSARSPTRSPDSPHLGDRLRGNAVARSISNPTAAGNAALERLDKGKEF